METLHQDPYFTVTLDAPRRLVVVRRSPTPFPQVTDAETSFERMRDLLTARALARHRLLVDSREAIGRNDPEFEAVTSRFRSQLFVGFERTAMLVRTAVGRMQLQRIAREQGDVGAQVFLDEDEALRYLTGA